MGAGQVLGRKTQIIAGILAGLALTAACTSAPAPGPAAGNDQKTSAAPAVPATLDLGPKDGSNDVAPGEPVTAVAGGSTLSEVTLAAADGAPVPGEMDAAKQRWTSSKPLDYRTKYTLTARSVGADGNPVTRTSTFTTATAKAQAYPSVIPLDGETTGVGMPITIKFSAPVADKAAAEKMLTVTSDKPATGAWRWFGDDEVHYRTKEYWPAYSTVTLDIKIAGRALGNGVFGKADRKISFKTGPSIISKVSDKEKQMRTYKDGQLVLTSPVSLGKPSARSVSGTMLIMTVQSPYTMDSSTYGVPTDSPGGYRTTVKYALRLTNSGQFLHSAPWSVRQQGRTNTSHGCLNVSVENAKWFYENSHRGDVVVVTDTGVDLKPGDGWTDWRFSWDEWQKKV
ncbi:MULTISPECIES: Ig-like domain-containing protein [unclassified Amycolatopsis]|uniref:L,D-transpeptidase n=1 Tax=unclassified Amycolatopsis TaxID=2618356 RepID=UPI00106E2DD1|nr:MULTISPECIES: Ig-like domain-containing protein [unclassified Amycolatopsis]